MGILAEACHRGAANGPRRIEEKRRRRIPQPFTSYRTGGRTPPAHLPTKGTNVSEIEQSTGMSRRAMMTAALAGGAGAMALPAFATDALAASAGKYPAHPKWRFVFVNHVTTNPFFVPTRYGAEDACTMTNTSYQWTGSETAKTPEMINAMNAAISGKADGIAVCVVDPEGVRRRHRQGAQGGHPGRRLQRRRLGQQQAARLHRPGSLQLGRRDGQAHRHAGHQGRPDRALHRHARPVQHPAAHRRRAVGAQGQVQDRRDHDRRRPARRALEDRRVRPGPLRRQGPVRRGRRLDPGHRADHEEARPAGQGRQGRRLRPAADHARS